MIPFFHKSFHVITKYWLLLEAENKKLEEEVAAAEQEETDATELGTSLDSVDSKVEQLTSGSRKFIRSERSVKFVFIYQLSSWVSWGTKTIFWQLVWGLK